MLVQLLKTRAKRAVTDSMTFALKKVRVKVNQGVVRGCEEKLPNGRSFFRFSGIPFAKPPINELRYRSPQKLLKFDKDEIDCTRERDVCFHKSPVWLRFCGSEDCLNLNVYVPADIDKSKKLPVMLWVHGGAFVTIHTFFVSLDKKLRRFIFQFRGSTAIVETCKEIRF
jgi:Carboxylesterase family